ncbi:MAG TPA: hypothetical protein VGB62_10200 [Allosphingosinicella sp.]|jgi:hypothetical protein
MKRRNLALAGLGLAAFACGNAASAQFGTGQSGSSSSVPVSNVRPYKELQSYGTCLARTARKGALAVIATEPGSREESKILDKYFYGEQTTCMFGGTRMQMPALFARGALAEGLLRSDGVPAEYRLAAPVPSEVKDLHGVARCYTAGHRSEVETLLKTNPGTAEEVKAVAGLWNDFRTCMPGFKVRLNAPWIRFLLAEALLRLEPNTTASGQ